MKIYLTMTPVLMRSTLALLMAIFLFGNLLIGNAQIPPTEPITPQAQDGTFQSESDGFSVTVPDGWVMQDVYSTDTDTLLDEIMQGSRLLARLCPEQQAVADIEGRYSCEESYENIQIQRYPNLADESEFASLVNGTISNEDLVDYHILKLQKLGYTGISVVQNTKLTIDVRSSDTNNTIAIVPANLIELTYNNASSVDTRGYFMLAATNATSNVGIISGYTLSYEADAATLSSGRPPEPIQQIFQSFEFVKEARGGELGVRDHDHDNAAAAAAGGDTTQRSTQVPENILSSSVGPPDQSKANSSSSRRTSGSDNDVNNESKQDYKSYLVEMVQGASTMTDKAYSPNPIEVKLGDTVKWINHDTSPHTATPGQVGSAESGTAADVLLEGETYSITFDEPGKYAYFCVLHPNMAGTVIVTEA
jgi:plastocyanin